MGKCEAKEEERKIEKGGGGKENNRAMREGARGRERESDSRSRGDGAQASRSVAVLGEEADLGWLVPTYLFLPPPPLVSSSLPSPPALPSILVAFLLYFGVYLIYSDVF